MRNEDNKHRQKRTRRRIKNNLDEHFKIRSVLHESLQTHTYTLTYIHTYIHTYTHIYTRTQTLTPAPTPTPTPTPTRTPPYTNPSHLGSGVHARSPRSNISCVPTHAAITCVSAWLGNISAACMAMSTSSASRGCAAAAGNLGHVPSPINHTEQSTGPTVGVSGVRERRGE